MVTQYYTAVSLDGYIATEDDSLEWLFALGDLEETSYPEFIKDVGAHAMGSATYNWMLNHFADSGENIEEAWPYDAPVWVFSSRPQPSIDGADIRFVSGDVAVVHQQMKNAASGKNIWLMGGGDLVGQFYDLGLLDEIIVQIGSVTLGTGKPLLPRRILSPRLKLRSANTMGDGFAELRYDVLYDR